MELELEGFENLIGADSPQIDKPDQNIIDRLRFDDAMDIPWQITDLDLWENYVDEDLYQLDLKIREFFRKNRVQRERKKSQRTSVPLVFAWMFGRPPTPNDSQVCVKLHKLLKYYCTRYTGSTTIKGKRFNRVYYFSAYSTRYKRPYSLKLRLELKNDSSAFQPYGSNRYKGPASKKEARLADRGNGPGVDGGSCPYKRGSDAAARLPESRAKSVGVLGSETVHGRSVQSGHQSNPDDSEQN